MRKWRKAERARQKLERQRRAGLEMTRRQWEKGQISDEDYEELREFWEEGDPKAVARAIKRGGRKAGPVGRLVTPGLVRVLGRRRKGRE